MERSSAIYEYFSSAVANMMGGSQLLAGYNAPPFGQSGMGSMPATLAVLVQTAGAGEVARGFDQKLQAMADCVFQVHRLSGLCVPTSALTVRAHLRSRSVYSTHHQQHSTTHTPTHPTYSPIQCAD
jgi:hypothetical protein